MEEIQTRYVDMTILWIVHDCDEQQVVVCADRIRLAYQQRDVYKTYSKHRYFAMYTSRLSRNVLHIYIYDLYVSPYISLMSIYC